jgi:hypothetical protein
MISFELSSLNRQFARVEPPPAHEFAVFEKLCFDAPAAVIAQFAGPPRGVVAEFPERLTGS